MTSADLSAFGYQDKLKELRKHLRLAQIAIFGQSSQAITVLKGYDAAGRGGVIRHCHMPGILVELKSIRLVRRA